MPRIRVRQSRLRPRAFHWNCQADHIDYSTQPHGWAPTIAAAADAGRKHLAEHHVPTVGTYCRAHGCQRVQCGCALGDQNGAFVAPRGHTEPSSGSSDDFPCCADLTPDILRAHNHSREGA